MNARQMALDAARRLVDHADFKLGGALSADSPSKDIPSNAVSQVKTRHLASLRSALESVDLEAVQDEPSKDVILEALHKYRCSERVDEDGDGSRLMDVLTHGGDVGPGVREVEALADFVWGALEDATPQEPAVNAGLLEALRLLVEIIEKAGLLNLSSGVQLGRVSWYVKASDRLDYARAAIAKYKATKEAS